MKKEVIFAILLGIVVGLVVMFGIYTANTALKKTIQRSEKQKEESETTTQTIPGEQTSLTIFSPEDSLLTEQDVTTFSGKTYPNSTIVIFVNDQEVITTADATGNFSVDLSLEGGSNFIFTTATSINGEQSIDQRVVVYSTADLTQAPATESASLISAGEDS